MSWPTPQDYNEAVQNPRLVFRDPELQEGRPELTSLGLPRPITGGFATVYKFQCAQRTWAVRCFLRPIHDRERRYAVISNHLSRVRLPYTLGFVFQREGIRVNTGWFPILKMEWVEGERLDAYIEKHLGNRDILLSVARRWGEMVKALRDASIAHGDLQHGNVLVADGELRLVDYDGMYVPALSGEGSHEVGHRNYQHPLRTEADFGPYLDNFSTWVVYVSLIVLAIDPVLWRRFGGGDECLLFRRRDFEQPETSDLFRSLETHRDEAIRSAATLFKSLQYFAPRDVPSLDGRVPLPAVATTTTRSAGTSWIDDHIGPGQKTRAADATSAIQRGSDIAAFTAAEPSWILDVLIPQEGSSLVSFSNSAALERIVFAVSAISIAVILIEVLLIGTVPDLLPLNALSVILLNLTLWVCRYHSDDSVRRLRDLASKVREIENHIRATECEIETSNQEKTKLGNHIAAGQARLAMELKALEAEETKEISALQTDLQSILSSIATRRRTLNQQQADAFRRIQDDIGSKIATLNGRISALNQAETTELDRALQTEQQQHITDYLRKFRLDRAIIPGIGRAFKERLMGSGFHTAADIEFYRVLHVNGIGPARARSLSNWRAGLETGARKTIPSALSPIEAAAIRAKYEGQRRLLEQQRDCEQQRQRREEDNVRARYRPLLEQLVQEEKSVNGKTQTAINEVRARYAQQYRAIQDREVKPARDTASRLQEIDGRIAEARKNLFSLHWEKVKAERKLRAYVGIRFPKYLKRIFLGAKAS